MDNATPQSAIVCATVDGIEIEIDFLTHVLGVKPKALERSAAEIIAPLRVGDEVTTIEIPIMHPLHCLQSRVANVVKLGRKDDVARRQLAAAPYVVREYVSEVLNAGDNDEASQTLQRLFEYLRSDIHGRVAHEYCENDPVAVIDHFAQDERFDPRYRENNIATMQKVLRGRRESRGLLLQNIAAMKARGMGR
jgi:hypothetical protein